MARHGRLGRGRDAPLKWQPAKPRVPIKVVECGPGKWDEQDHGLDYPEIFYTTDFRVTGRGHERIETLYQNGCRERGASPDQRIWPRLCLYEHEDGVWELKSADIRVFGWFYKRDVFIAAAADAAWKIKEYCLYAGYRDQTKRDRDALDLDPPKFIAGSDPNAVVSCFHYP